MLIFGGLNASAADAVPLESAAPAVATSTLPELSPAPEENPGGWVMKDGARKYQYSDGSYAIQAATVDGVLYLFRLQRHADDGLAEDRRHLALL